MSAKSDRWRKLTNEASASTAETTQNKSEIIEGLRIDNEPAKKVLEAKPEHVSDHEPKNESTPPSKVQQTSIAPDEEMQKDNEPGLPSQSSTENQSGPELTTEAQKLQQTNVMVNPFMIGPDERKPPQRETHTPINPSIETAYLDKLDNIADCLGRSRNNLINEIIKKYVDHIGSIHPEYLEPKPKTLRGRR